MQKAAAFLLLLVICLPIPLAAQEENSPDNPDWDYYYDETYTRGDQTLIISLGAVFPTFFFDGEGKIIDHKFTPPVGGTMSLAYNYYFTAKFFAGVEAEGLFFSTLGSNMLFTIPVSVRGGYQFSIMRFDFPVNLGLGMVWHRYLNQTYYGFFAKAGGGAFFRASTNWSFGIVTNLYWYPQWAENKSETVYGNIINAALAARYHF
jgi:hypothetical protein